jgi:hypothetical protein
MLKLLRNRLHDLDTICSPQGQLSFETFKSVLDVQKDVGLRPSNELSHRHYAYQNLKMKVIIALNAIDIMWIPGLFGRTDTFCVGGSGAGDTLRVGRTRFRRLFASCRILFGEGS